CLLHAYLEHNWVSFLFFFFPGALFRQACWGSGTARLPLDRASCGNTAKTQEKFYHTASARFVYPTRPARRGRFSRGSASQSPVSVPTPPPALGTPRTGSGPPPARHALAPQPPDRLAPRTASGPRSRKKADRPARPLLARNWRWQTAPHSACS